MWKKLRCQSRPRPDEHQSKQVSSIFAYRFQPFGWISQEAGSISYTSTRVSAAHRSSSFPKMKLDDKLLRHYFCYASAEISGDCSSKKRRRSISVLVYLPLVFVIIPRNYGVFSFPWFSEASKAVVFIAKLVNLIMETPIELHYKSK